MNKPTTNPGAGSKAKARHVAKKAVLVRHERTDSGEAFFPDPSDMRHRSNLKDPLGEMLGEEFVQSATSGEASRADDLDEVTTEELGGPFVLSTAAEEVGSDEPETPEATREPFPTAHRPNGSSR